MKKRTTTLLVKGNGSAEFGARMQQQVIPRLEEAANAFGPQVVTEFCLLYGIGLIRACGEEGDVALNMFWDALEAVFPERAAELEHEAAVARGGKDVH